MSKLPNSWLATSLGNVVEYGKTKKAEPDEISDDTWVLELEDVEKNSSRLLARLTYKERCSKSTKNQFEKGDILYGKLRPYLNKVLIADKPGVCTTEIIPLKTGDFLNNRYLFYWLKHPKFLAYVESESHGVNMPRLGTDAGKAAPFVLAPSREQERIADKLDTVLARVDACRDRLDRLPALLKRFRQSILAAATSGRLTDDWRRSSAPANDTRRSAVLLDQIFQEQLAVKSGNRGGKIEPQLSDLPDEIDLPDSWQVAGFDALAAPERNALKAGPFGSALKKSMYVPSGYKIYGQEQVISGDENFGDYYIDADKFQELSSCAVKSGDILISLVGTIGRVLILSEHAKLGIINPRLVKLSLHTAVSRTYIAMYLASPIAQHFFAKQSHGGTMDILNLGILRELPILFPPPEEQHEIVRRVEILFAFADRLESRLSTARKQVDQLTPALLAKAFRGELVPQDPADEPASELLKRLAAQRAAAPAPKRGRKLAAE